MYRLSYRSQLVRVSCSSLLSTFFLIIGFLYTGKAAALTIDGVYVAVPGSQAEEIWGDSSEFFTFDATFIFNIDTTADTNLLSGVLYDTRVETIGAGFSIECALDVLCEQDITHSRTTDLAVSANVGVRDQSTVQYIDAYGSAHYGSSWDFTPQPDGSILWSGWSSWSGGHIWQIRFDNVVLLPLDMQPQVHETTITAIPEPSSMLLLLLGCTALTVRSRRCSSTS